MPKHKELPELKSILELRNIKDDLVHSEFLDIVKTRKGEYPIVAFEIGSKKTTDPCLAIFGGVHGLERVGTHVAITFLNNILTRISWDHELREILQDFRIISVPLINPGGMALLHRSNPRGVDLMRNSPVECDEPLVLPVGGQRFSNKMPWYRGEMGEEMELETKAVIKFVKEKMFESSCSISLDIHSGFGMKDRLWYPYARTKKDFPYKMEMHRIIELLDKTQPHHIYQVEPQSDSYLTHGDLWDYLFDLHYNDATKKGIFVPLTLEMGSWLWVKKNPMQIFSILGLFNPLKQHRYNRIMRRHLLLMDFLGQAVKNPESWVGSRKYASD